MARHVFLIKSGRGHTDVRSRLIGGGHLASIDDVRCEAIVVKRALGGDAAIAGVRSIDQRGGVYFSFVGRGDVVCNVRCSGVGEFDCVSVKHCYVHIERPSYRDSFLPYYT